MISAKTVIGVIILAILIGVAFVAFEKIFTPGSALSGSESESAQELSKDAPFVQSSQINLPTPEPTPEPINESSNLLNEAENLQMRDYSGYFEDLKEKANE